MELRRNLSINALKKNPKPAAGKARIDRQAMNNLLAISNLGYSVSTESYMSDRLIGPVGS
jgi:hypothetical protein